MSPSSDMEWKLERSAARKVQTDEEVLWVKIMKALGTDLREIRQRHLQMRTKDIVDTELLPCGYTSQVDNREFPLTETPGKISYPHFKSCIVKKLSAQFPVASSPISTRWQQVYARNQAEQTFAECPPMELSTSDDGSDLTGTVEKITTLPGCEDGCKVECDAQGISAHASGFPHLETQIRFHITDLCNDYYLNLLDWSKENIIALALGSAVHIWNGKEPQHVESMSVCPSSKYIAFVAWMKEIAHFVFGTSDGEVQLWEIDTQKRLQNMFGHMSVVGALSWNGYMLSSGSRLGYIYHHDVQTAQHCIGMVRQRKQSVYSLQWSPNNKLLVCGSSDGLLITWSNDQGVTAWCRPLTLVLHYLVVKAMMWCPSQSSVIATGGEMKYRFLHIWNIISINDLKTANLESQICSLLWLPNTKEIVTGQDHPGNKINIWKYPMLSNSAEFYGHKGRVFHMTLSPEGNRIFTVAADGAAYEWKMKM